MPRLSMAMPLRAGYARIFQRGWSAQVRLSSTSSEAHSAPSTTAAAAAAASAEAATATSAEAATTPLTPLQQYMAQMPQWNPTIQRTGLLALKLGMTTMWTDEGRRIPLTVLKVNDCKVEKVVRFPETRFQKERLCAYVSISKKMQAPKEHTYAHSPFGAEKQQLRREMALCSANSRTGQVLRGERRAKAPPRARQQFGISAEAVVPDGTPLCASHFVPGQRVDVKSRTIGKGFQGVMKRHNHKGGPMSHGSTKFHRKKGAAGSGANNPGRIFPGTRLAGRMGNDNRTIRSLVVRRIDTAANLLYLQGSVAGNYGSVVRVFDSQYARTWRANAAALVDVDPATLRVRRYFDVLNLPMPAGTPELNALLPADVVYTK